MHKQNLLLPVWLPYPLSLLFHVCLKIASAKPTITLDPDIPTQTCVVVIQTFLFAHFEMRVTTFV